MTPTFHRLPALTLALAIAGCVATPAAHLPDALQPGADAAPLMTLSASGVRVYECRAEPSRAARSRGCCTLRSQPACPAPSAA